MGKKGTFKRGVHPPYNKGYTEELSIETMPAPAQVVLMMSMHAGTPCKPIVNTGDKVDLYQLVGEAQGDISANIHSSVSGTVTAVENRRNADGREILSVVVENDFKDTYVQDTACSDYLSLTKEQILEKITSAGIVGLGGAEFPTSVKLNVPQSVKIDHVILNGAECEPFLTSDHALMRQEPDKIIKGLEIIMKVFGLREGHIGVEDNKPDAIEALRKEAPGHVHIRALKTKYPQGSEKQLIEAMTGKQVPSGKFPAFVGCIVVNVATAAAVYDAVSCNTPLVGRIVTVTGSGIKTPKVLKVRIGTTVSDIIQYCGGLTDDVQKVILGGPMMGVTIEDTAVPVSKGTSGILCVNAKDAYISETTNCIRCAKCVQACPVGLMPLYIAAYCENGDIEMSKEYNALDCIECGCCSYICPARRPLVASIRVAKHHIQKEQRKNA